METRIEVDPEHPPVVVPGPVLHELYLHARETSPEECCGLITGDETERFLRVHRCENVMTQFHLEDPITWPRDNRTAFQLSPTEYAEIVTKANARGELVTAVYHSHDNAGVYFSAEDLAFARQELFPFPLADHIVISVWNRQVRGAGLFRREPGTDRFLGHPLEPGAP